MAEQKKRGRKPHERTEATAKIVKGFAAMGIRQEEIADYIGLKDPKTLRKYYADILSTATTEANAKVASSLYQNAVEYDNVTAQIFWLKTKGGWKETNHVEHTSPDGSMTPQKVDLSRLTTE